MKLNELLQGKETKNQFIDRCYANLCNYPKQDNVFIYPKTRGKGEPEIVSLEDFKRKLLCFSDNIPLLVSYPRLPRFNGKPKSELLKIEYHDRIEWKDSWTGEVVHSFELEAKPIRVEPEVKE